MPTSARSTLIILPPDGKPAIQPYFRGQFYQAAAVAIYHDWWDIALADPDFLPPAIIFLRAENDNVAIVDGEG